MKLEQHRIINARLARGWTQEQAAEAIGVSRPTYVRAEDGQDINPPTAKKIADGLGLVLGQVMIHVLKDEGGSNGDTA